MEAGDDYQSSTELQRSKGPAAPFLESEPQSELYLPLRRAGQEGQSRAPTHTSGDLGRIGIDRERRWLGVV